MDSDAGGSDSLPQRAARSNLVAGWAVLAESWVTHNLDPTGGQGLVGFSWKREKEAKRALEGSGVLSGASGRSEVTAHPMRVHTGPMSIPVLHLPLILGPRTQSVESILLTVWWNLSWGCSAGAQVTY